MATNPLRSEPALPPVLVVEPQAFPRRTLKRVLRALGVAGLMDCADADAAVAALEGARPRDWIVLCDAEVAAENDWALPRRISTAFPNVRMALLGARRPDELAALERAGTQQGHEFLAVLRKPVSAEELRTLLYRASAPPAAACATHAPIEPEPRVLTAEEVTESLRAEWLHAYFQPRVSLANGRTVGCEALARILHPAMGELLPARFLGAIDAVDGQRTLAAHMLEKAGLLMRALRAAAMPLTTSINVSADCLSEPGDGAKLAAYAGALGLRPNELVIEITQQAVLTASVVMLDNLAKLKLLGYALSIDDFGTAGTSLEALLRLPCAEIKLDRSLVTRLALAPDAALANALGEARRSGLVICAEAIETPAELEAMRALGADFAQGRLFAPPMPAADLLAWLRQFGVRPRARQAESFASLT